jgi:Fic family protein
MTRYVWQSPAWPELSYEGEKLLGPLGNARQALGRLLGSAHSVGLAQQAEVLAEEAFQTASIEGEKLDRDSIRSSVARRLGLPTAGLPVPQRHVDGLVAMLVDATTSYDQPLSADRLKSWQAALFPTGYSGLRKIETGNWRTATAPMQVVSGPVGKERVHYQAPPADRVATEMDRFLDWWNSSSIKSMDGLVRAGLAHFRFVTIHPFEDGNGRVARAITDMALAQDEGSSCRLYSMSAQINSEKDVYYEILAKTQKGVGEVTGWLVWFLGCLERSIQRSEEEVSAVVQKARFWENHVDRSLNDRQRKVINRLLDAGPGKFEGGLTNRKYVGLTGVSRETAKRDIADLLSKGILRRNPGRGRSASYDLVWTGVV